MYDLAEKLGRTVQELLYGSGGHTPISSAEIVEWAAYYKLKAHDAENEIERIAGRTRHESVPTGQENPIIRD